MIVLREGVYADGVAGGDDGENKEELEDEDEIFIRRAAPSPDINVSELRVSPVLRQEEDGERLDMDGEDGSDFRVFRFHQGILSRPWARRRIRARGSGERCRGVSKRKNRLQGGGSGPGKWRLRY